ncbi:MAG: hypothetical protein CVU39_05055 [Chloroflexi bacterium HGW-Chloroflexi-10]|nr:MAG: hypothetical protein CVU39_05055 [Chloroflexi bacterium HGW-Chloroflexi-10]
MSNPSEKTFTIDLEPIGKRIQLNPDKTIADAAMFAGIPLVTSCNGLGICASCKILLVQGQLTAPTVGEKSKLSEAAISEGIRLACQARPLSDVRIHIPPGSLTFGQQLQIEGIHNLIPLSPTISPLNVQLSPPSQSDLDSDFERLRKVYQQYYPEPLRASLSVLRTLPGCLRKNNWNVRLILKNNELVSILPTDSEFFGLALDIGSTKIAAYWVSLNNGTIIKQAGFMNPQISYGEDVVNRISFANQGKKQQNKLQQVLIESINQHILETCRELNIYEEQIVDLVVVGNTVIHHLFCGLPVRSMGEAPYVSVVKKALTIPSSEFNLFVAPGAKIYLPPNIAGYVGADHTAALSAVRLFETGKTICLIDIGTNTEISLIHNKKIIACSCASGPAFEGAHIRDGMRAAPGAIEKVSIQNNTVSFSTIGQKQPVGICGSGILSVAAEMRKNAIIDHRGVFQKKHPLTRTEGKQSYFVLAESDQLNNNHAITISRSDINEIQLAKGAIRTGIEILCQKSGIIPQQIDQFLIAGAFGTYLDLESAIEIGMFPDVELDRFQQIGNAAGVGARELLINAEQRHQLEIMADQIEYVELTSELTFNDTYVLALYLEKNDSLFTKI